MFRAQIIQLANGPTLKMEGNLVGQWAEEAKSLVTNGPVPKGLIIDLTDVSYVDSVGEKVLSWFASVGASFMAKAVYSASLCEQLQLPVHRIGNPSRTSRLELPSLTTSRLPQFGFSSLNSHRPQQCRAL